MNYQSLSGNTNSRHDAECARGTLDVNVSQLAGSAQHSNTYAFDYAVDGIDHALQIHEYERQRLGQELHDSTGQLVVSLLLGLSRLRNIGHDHGEGSVIEDIEQTARQIEKEIRSLAFLHYPAELGDRSLSSSLESLVLGFGRRTGIQVTFKRSGQIPPIGELLSTALLRIAQEALVNVHRHARATAARVELKSAPTYLQLQISDDGVGLPEGSDPSTWGGIGLKGMRHRVEAHGGQFELRRLKRGLMICATIPLPA